MRGRATVLRGGSWNNDPINLRTANRNNNTPDNRNNNIGFRCASESSVGPRCRASTEAGYATGETPRPCSRLAATPAEEVHLREPASRLVGRPPAPCAYRLARALL